MIVLVFGMLAAAVYYAIGYLLPEEGVESGETGEERTVELLFEEYVLKYSAEYSVPEYTVYAVIRCESSFNENAVSHAGAIGLMQLIPSTFEWLCGFTGEEPLTERLYDPETNIRYGTMFLARLYAQYGDWDIVHAAYNAGQGRVNQWLSDERYSEDGKLTNIPFKETKAYVEKVKRYKELYKRLYNEKGWN